MEGNSQVLLGSSDQRPTSFGHRSQITEGPLYSGVRPFSSYMASMSDEFQVLRLAVVSDPPSGYGFVNGAARWQAINFGVLHSYTYSRVD